MSHKILILSGDGIGPEIMAEAEKALSMLIQEFGLRVEIEHGLVGGAALDATGGPLPETTLALARSADAVLFGAIGGPQWDTAPRELRPERGLLGLRSGMGVFANLRPVQIFPELVSASALKPEVVSGLDILIVRELTGGIYFGQPRELTRGADGRRFGVNTLRYNEDEIRRIARVAFAAARGRGRRLCSVDKANVLETSELWRQVVVETAAEFPEVQLEHMYVDNAAMQLVRSPKQFDVMVTDNMFGDILSDLASMLSGSIGMLPSASLDERRRGLYEPIHGSAPDIAGRGVANPLATVLSLALLLRHSLGEQVCAVFLEQAVRAALQQGLRTADIHSPGTTCVGTGAMGDAVVAALRRAAAA
ncbi:MAG: 3-isopropylmalate dehydrogenase [Gammaproteobacteria bacterium RIFCSPLOWO2_02_FULL_61_13]|nr:MAG: 3-isopropylmalate dehydrogenase [Gammaproteobacteria bacterium RIFCSPLOWO2_02_FULL_61_13]